MLGSICEWPKEGQIMYILRAFLRLVSWRRLLLPRYFVQTAPLAAPNMASSNITFPQLHTDLIHVLLLCLNFPSKHIFMPPMSCYSPLQIILWWCHYLLLWHTSPESSRISLLSGKWQSSVTFLFKICQVVFHTLTQSSFGIYCLHLLPNYLDRSGFVLPGHLSQPP